ncbi:MAG: response regulator [Proteobacteria bacterium]|nr:response regulator [Pseudomonadota bacterium]
MSYDKANILVVDDTPENIDLLVEILKGDYKVRAAINGEQGLKIARLAKSPDLILLDVMMPGIDGFEVCRQLKADPTTSHIPIIFVTAKITTTDEIKGFSLGAIDYITKPISPPVVLARVKTYLALYDQNRELDRKVREQTRDIHDTRLKIIQRLGRAAEFKDDSTGMHVIRMSHYARVLGMAAGMNETMADMMLDAAPMHDIGKIGIPDRILQKSETLDEEEWRIMQTHTQMGQDIIGDDDSELLKMANAVAISHHEHWDGSGYPNQLAGDDIPMVGRIVAIADVFDALTSVRPYKDAWTIEDALAYLQQHAGTQFDEKLVFLFIENIEQVLAIKEQYIDRGKP